MIKESVFSPSLLQVTWDQKPSEVFHVRTGLKAIDGQRARIHQFRGFLFMVQKQFCVNLKKKKKMQTILIMESQILVVGGR